MNLSVIVPVYNAAKYLNRCIDSIISQTIFELILIDDGSNDNSGLICDNYAAIDSRIKVIHQKNLGVSVARNNGIKVSKGDWLAFVDADDWVENDWHNVIISQDVTQVDIIALGFRRIKDNIEKLHSYDCCLKNTSDYLMSNISPFGWSYIYRKTIIDNYKIEFPEGLKLSEDEVFVLKFLSVAQRILFLNQILYTYFEHQQSAVSSSAGKELTTYSLMAANDYLLFANKYTVEDKIKLRVSTHFYEQFFWYFSLITNKLNVAISKQKLYKHEYVTTLKIFPQFRKNKYFHIAYYCFLLAYYLQKVTRLFKKYINK